RADEGAAPEVAEKDRALHLRPDAPRVLRLTAGGARPAGGGVLLLHQVLDQQVERAREDLCGVSAGDRVAEQVLRELELLARIRRRGEGDLKPIRRQRADQGSRRRGYRQTGRG